MISKTVERHKAGVYKITNLINLRIYIGGSKEIYNRKHTHISKIKSNTHSCKELQEEYHLYGGDNFLFEVLEYCNNYEEREQYYLDLLCPTYNKRTNTSLNVGVEKDSNVRDRISKSLKEKYKKGMQAYNQIHLWKIVEQYDLEGNFINSYSNFKLAAIAIGVSETTVSRGCKEKEKTVKGLFQLKTRDDKKEIIKGIEVVVKNTKSIKVTNVTNNLFKIFRSLEEVQKHFKAKGLYKLIGKPRLYKYKYKFEYYEDRPE